MCFGRIDFGIFTFPTTGLTGVDLVPEDGGEGEEGGGKGDRESGSTL